MPKLDAVDVNSKNAACASWAKRFPHPLSPLHCAGQRAGVLYRYRASPRAPVPSHVAESIVASALARKESRGPITGRTNRSATMSTGSSIRWGLENRTDRAYSMALLQLPDSNRSSTHMSTCTHLYCVFIYGINIPGCQTFTRKTIQGRLSCSGQDDFTLVWIGPRPDTLVIKSQTRNSATYVAEWVARQIGRPAVGRDSDCIRALYPKALDLAKMQFKERVDPKKRGEARQRPVEAWRCFREPRCSRTSGYERYDGCESSGKIPG
jgi:hypothetical protein